MPRPVTRSSADGHYTMWPNDFWDQLALTLDPVDVTVLAHLYRLASIVDERAPEVPLGYCKISLPRLCARVNCQLTRLRNSLARLEARELIERVYTDGESLNVNERGVIWRINLDFIEAKARVTKQDRSQNETGHEIAPMKENQKETPKDELSLMVVRIITAAQAGGEERLSAREVEVRLREALAITGRTGDFTDVEIIAAARKFGREGD